jgi:hypothetical protein
MSESMGEPGKAISNLEKALLPHNFLLMAIFTLLVDSSLLKLHGFGLLDCISSSERLKPSFALEVFLLFVGYSFLMAILMPVFSYFSNSLFLQLVWSPWKQFEYWFEKLLGFKDRLRSEKPSFDCVSFYDLQKAAHTKKDQYLLDLCWKEEKQKNSAHTSSLNFQLYSVGALLVMGVNYYLSGKASLLNRIALYLDSEYWIIAALALTAFCAFGLQFFLNQSHWIYCPSLARDIEKERIKNKSSVLRLNRNQKN